LPAARAGATQYAGEYWDDFVDGMDFFFVADNAVNLLRSYERNCLDGRLAAAACGQRLAIDSASNLLWNLPLIENYAGAVGGVLAVSEGDAGGFLSLTVAPKIRASLSVIFPSWFVSHRRTASLNPMFGPRTTFCSWLNRTGSDTSVWLSVRSPAPGIRLSAS